VHLVGYGGDCPLWCLRGAWPSLLKAIVKNFAVWRKQSRKKRPGRRHEVIFQTDNARPHTANMTKATIQELDWEILLHPPFSPDLAPSDYHIFRSLSNNLLGVSFYNDAEIRNWLDEFFTAKSVNFFKRGNENLPERW
jgi:transposase